MGGIVENVQRKIFFHRAVEGCGGNVEKKVKNYFYIPAPLEGFRFAGSAGLLSIFVPLAALVSECYFLDQKKVTKEGVGAGLSFE